MKLSVIFVAVLVAAVSSSPLNINGLLGDTVKSISGLTNTLSDAVSGLTNTDTNEVSCVTKTPKKVVSGVTKTRKKVVSSATKTPKKVVSCDPNTPIGGLSSGVTKSVSGLTNTATNVVIGATKTPKNVVSCEPNTPIGGLSSGVTESVCGLTNTATNLVGGVTNTATNLVGGVTNTVTNVVKETTNTAINLVNTVDNTANTVLEELMDTLDQAVQSITTSTCICNDVIGSHVPGLNQLSGLLAIAFNEITNSLNVWEQLQLETSVQLVVSSIFEFLQATNFILETVPTALCVDTSVNVLEYIAIGLVHNLEDMIQDVVDAIESCKTDEAVASTVLVAQSVVAVVYDVATRLNELIISGTEITSNIISQVLRAIHCTLQQVDKVVGDVTSNLCNASKSLSHNFSIILGNLKSNILGLPADPADVVDEGEKDLENVLTENVAVNPDNVSPEVTPAVNNYEDAMNAVNGLILDAIEAISDEVPQIAEELGEAFANIVTAAELVLANTVIIDTESLLNFASAHGLADRLNCALTQLIAAVQYFIVEIQVLAGLVVLPAVANVLENLVASVVALLFTHVSTVDALLSGILQSDESCNLNQIISSTLEQITSDITNNDAPLSGITASLGLAVSILSQDTIAGLSDTLSAVLGSPAAIAGSLSGTVAAVAGQIDCLSTGITSITNNVSGLVTSLGDDVNKANEVALTIVATNFVAVESTLSSILDGLVGCGL